MAGFIPQHNSVNGPRRGLRRGDSAVGIFHKVEINTCGFIKIKMYTSEVFMAAPSSLISVRVPTDVAHRLEKLSQSVDRSKSYLAAEAIEEYLDLHEWQVQAIQNGLQEIEQGDVVNFVDVKKDLGLLDEN